MTLTELRISTPGRVCLFGEHQDYLNLPIIAAAISLRVAITGHRRPDSNVIIRLPDTGEEDSFSLGEPIVYGKERDYFKSAVNVLRRHGLTFSTGSEGVVRGEIPINAGTSSSSALVVTWINFLSRMSDQQLTLTAGQSGEYAYETAGREFSEPGGMMDQYSTAIGGIIFLESYPGIRVRKLYTKVCRFVLGNSGEPKDTKFILSRVSGQIQRVARELQKSHEEFSLQTASGSDIDKYSAYLTEEQTELLHGTIRNMDITWQALKALEAETLDHTLIGNLLNDHQAVLRDILKISTPKIDRMIAAALDAGAYGAKINGSGGGGCMFAYAPDDPERVKKAIEKEGGDPYIVTVADGTTSPNSEGV